VIDLAKSKPISQTRPDWPTINIHQSARRITDSDFAKSITALVETDMFFNNSLLNPISSDMKKERK
jgi:hypothetical protein